MQLIDLEPTIEDICSKVMYVENAIEHCAVHNKNDTKSNRILLLKEFINKILSRYCIYKSDISYVANSDSIDFNFIVYINGNQYTITVTEREIITQNGNYQTFTLMNNPSIIEYIISTIDSDLYTLTYMNA